MEFLPLVEDALLRRAMRASERRALRSVLKRVAPALSPLALARVVARVGIGSARGEPFRSLPRADDRREALSRQQLQGAVLLRRALAREVRPDDAMAITRDVVLDAGETFLGTQLAEVSPHELLASDAPDVMIGRIVGRFFNAEGDVEGDVDAREVRFAVRQCRFVNLLDAIGEREMMPLFCEVDARYFSRDDAPFALERPATLARGDAYCDFRFRPRTDSPL